MKRLFSGIIAFFIAFFSYPISFFPSQNDSEFSFADARTNFEIDSIQGQLVFTPEEQGKWFNYYGLLYSSDAHVKGVIEYSNGFGQTHCEEFFLEPGENACFYSFIDGCLRRTKAWCVQTIRVTPLDRETMDFSLQALSLFNRAVPDREIFISNAYFKMGVDLQWGGALSYLEDLNSNVQAVKKDGRIFVDSDASTRYGVKAVSRHVNLLNRHDAGRLVQQSYYGTNADARYTKGTFMGNAWPYNPVQGGNQFADCSKLVDLRVTNESIYIKCRPMDWAKDAEAITPSYMEAEYSFVADCVHTNCRFVDFSGYEAGICEQELPAFYCIEPFNRFVYYGGDAPWQEEDGLVMRADLEFWADNAQYFRSAEQWCAFVGEFEDSFGVGIYVPGKDLIKAGVYKREQTRNTDPSMDDATSYIAVLDRYVLSCFEPICYDFYIAGGNVHQIRESFCAVSVLKNS